MPRGATVVDLRDDSGLLNPEVLTVVGAAAVLSMLGHMSHLLSEAQKLDYKRFVGGVLFSGFTSSICCMMMLSTGMEPLWASAFSAMIGSTGQYGFNFLIDTYTKGGKR